MNNYTLAKCLRYQRTDYAKKIRKDYEAGKIQERRCNMREYTVREDDCSNTLTGVQKDNYIVVGCAMRGRYSEDNKIDQHLEVNSTEYSNALTTVQKDSLILEIRKSKES